MKRLLVVIVLVACSSKTPKLQSHDLPNKKGTTVYEPKCADNPPTPCRKLDLQCTQDEARACYVCQCQMSGDEPPDSVPTSRPPDTDPK